MSAACGDAMLLEEEQEDPPEENIESTLEPAEEGACEETIFWAKGEDKLLPGSWHIRLSDKPEFDLDFVCISEPEPEDVTQEKCNRDNYPEKLVYTTIPASSGPHYGSMWARYGVHDVPVDPRFYVHNLEHGSVILFYRCDTAKQCPRLAKSLASVAQAFPDDQDCIRRENGARNQIIVAPNPDLDVPVAAVSWGFTFKASCVNKDRLLSFIDRRYKFYDPEPSCWQGLTQEQMNCRMAGGTKEECGL